MEVQTSPSAEKFFQLQTKIPNKECESLNKFFETVASTLSLTTLNSIETWNAYSSQIASKYRTHKFSPDNLQKLILELLYSNNDLTENLKDLENLDRHQFYQKYFRELISLLRTSEMGGLHTLLINLKITEIAFKHLFEQKIEKLEPNTRLEAIQDLIQAIEAINLSNIDETGINCSKLADLLVESRRKSSSGNLRRSSGGGGGSIGRKGSGGAIKLLRSLSEKSLSLYSGWETDLLFYSSNSQDHKEVLKNVMNTHEIELMFSFSKKTILEKLKHGVKEDHSSKTWTKTEPQKASIHPLQLNESEFFRHCTISPQTYATCNGSITQEMVTLNNSFLYYDQDNNQTFLPPISKKDYLLTLTKNLGIASDSALIEQMLNATNEEAMKEFLKDHPEFQMLFYTTFGAFSPLPISLMSIFGLEQKIMNFFEPKDLNYLIFLSPKQVVWVRKFYLMKPHLDSKFPNLNQELFNELNALRKAPQTLSHESSPSSLPTNPLEAWKQKKTTWTSELAATFCGSLSYDLSQFEDGILKPNATLTVDTLDLNPLITGEECHFVLDSLNAFSA